jgi:hypothetical protein
MPIAVFASDRDAFFLGKYTAAHLRKAPWSSVRKRRCLFFKVTKSALDVFFFGFLIANRRFFAD